MGEYGNDRRFITTTNSSINTTLALARAYHGLHLAPHRSCGALNEPQAVMTTQNYKAKSGFQTLFALENLQRKSSLKSVSCWSNLKIWA